MKFAFLILLTASMALAVDKIKLVSTTTDLAWAAQQVAGVHAEVRSLLNGTENPHFVDTVPEFIRLVGEAHIVCLVGMELEIGWMPKVLSRSGNAQVQPGGKGYCEVGSAVTPLEKPTGAIDRSMGDIHPAGNPHFWLSPKALAQASTAIRDALVRVDPQHLADYTKNQQALAKSLEDLHQKNMARLAPALAKLKGPAVIEYHKEFTYFFDAYGIKSFGSIEEKPGIPPSAGRIAEIAVAAQSAGVKLTLAGEYAPSKTLERFSELSGIKAERLATSIQPKGKNKGYIEFQNSLVETVLAALSLN
ncbi:MAG: zinc ABC transporter substrate-binding protein [Deltaproteobacteria bacterium]|nr:zinc ABC transporter substrate-binding protein [Deltaproteobacteria bacterium]MBI3293306.1 zinc ABC transporter substrate-binding protein [Deltaproteobacteria bacterium]